MAWGLRHISSRELTEWRAYAQLDPFDGTRDDLRAGIVAATIANVFRGKDAKAFTPGDFMPTFGPAPLEKQTVAQMLTQVQLFNAAFGGRDLRRKR